MFRRAMAMLCLLIASRATAADPVPAKQDTETQTIMHAILAPLSKVLPLSFNRDEFAKKENHEQILAQLKLLRDNVAVLDHHAKGKDRAFEFIAKSLRNDATRTYRWFSLGRYEEAEFTLHNMTNNCIACHANLPETHKVPPASAFFAALKIESLSPLERAHFQVVTRQFDAAMTTYEGLFTSSEVPPGSLLMLASFIDYLKIAANAKGDLSRPRELIDRLLAKPNVPLNVRQQLERWTAGIQAVSAAKDLQKSDLETARRLVAAGRAQMEFARDKDGLIPYLAAAAILNRYVHSHPDHGTDVAEAYYLLGVTESLLGRSFWISREEFDFESAIRLAPAAGFAPKAYTLLEESYTVGFSGSSGTHVPDDVKSLLLELRRLIDEAQGRKS